MKLGHYTNTQGILGIYQSKTLRATNIKYLNDEHEFSHALDLIKTIISETDRQKSAPHTEEFNEFLEVITKKSPH